ncbi:MAG: porin [Alphaproteobacteria bacterium]
MKKVLLTTSALAGASLLTAGTAAAEAPTVSFSGAVTYEMIWNGGDVPAAGTGFNISANEQQSELVWVASGSSDNGLNYGARLDWRVLAGGGASAFDESWVDVSGSFGRIYLGQEDGVIDLIASHSGHSMQVGTWGTDGNNALRHVSYLGLNTGLHYYASHSAQTSDNNKIGYVTPNFSGFQAGVAFTPNSAAAQAAGTNNDNDANAFEVAVAWNGDLGDVALGIGGGYAIADDQSSTNGTQPPEDQNSYNIGATVGFAGFTVGAAYINNEDSNCAAATTTCDAGDGWNIGAGYNFGPGAVSIMYQTAEDDTDGNGRSDESAVVHAGINYTIADGLSTHLNGYWFDLENEAGSGVATNSNDAQVIILGTRVSF